MNVWVFYIIISAFNGFTQNHLIINHIFTLLYTWTAIMITPIQSRDNTLIWVTGIAPV
jgi:hypothetical protein